MAFRNRSVERTLYDLGKALGGARAPSRRTIQAKIASGNVGDIVKTVARYAAGGSTVASPGLLGSLQQVLNMLGLGGIQSRRSRRGGDRVTQAAGAIADLLDLPDVQPNTRTAGRPPSRPPGVPPSAPAPQPQPSPGSMGGGFNSRFPGSTLEYGAEPPLPGQQSPYGEEILTPQSSNVFSFSYMRLSGQRTGTLYVTYRQSVLNTEAISVGRTRRGRSLSRKQLNGTLGSTVKGKSDGRGPMYAYLRVPPAIYSRLKAVAGQGHKTGPGVFSPGTGIWQLLRVHGSPHAHRYQYVLVQGSVTIQDGVSGVYVPRKATSQGFRSRSVRDIGGKGFQTSTLPAQQGFSTRTRKR